MGVFGTKELLEIQVATLQRSLPRKVMWRGQPTHLSKEEKMACGRAVWYIIIKGYGINTAVQLASYSKRRKTKHSPTKIERAIRLVFPKNYFAALEKAKNRQLFAKLEEEEN
jgi:hypothetical protein